MSQQDIKISCAILAGGKATRFNGENKALLRLGSLSNLEKIIEIGNQLFSETLLITNTPKDYFNLEGILCIEDEIANVGPLGGIYSALKRSNQDAVFVFACDMPFLNREIIKEEIKLFRTHQSEIIVPRVDNLIEPLHSIYSKKITQKLEQYLLTTNDYSIRKFYQKSDVYFWDVVQSDLTRKAFFNINSQIDLLDAEYLNKAKPI
ncbi:MAG: molybdenum cofactor guanylyltransferase [Candidatus Cloacimonetes bacterium]|nr:molybdenum cofactor guanylyltransferase [Candidatus Cloacimonadota bacterium]